MMEYFSSLRISWKFLEEYEYGANAPTHRHKQKLLRPEWNFWEQYV